MSTIAINIRLLSIIGFKALCAPADISYPNDLGLLNQARQQTEKILDSLYEPLKGK